MSRKRQVDHQAIKQAAEKFFQQAKSCYELTRIAFMRFSRVNQFHYREVFPLGYWRIMQHKWVLDRLPLVMEQVYKESRIRNDFAVEKIIKKVGISRELFMKLAGDDWKTRRNTLPTAEEKVLQTIDDLVAANTPVAELTRHRVVEIAGVCVPTENARVSDALRAAHLKLTKQQQQVNDPPAGVNAYHFTGGWVDVDKDEWDFRGGKGLCIRRDQLREDFADIAWSSMREQLMINGISFRTATRHFYGYKQLANILGAEVPDVRLASLESVQRAWVRYSGTHGQRVHIRTVMFRLFTTLTLMGKDDATINVREMVRIAAWSGAMNLGGTKRGEGFLSEAEFNAVADACLKDIKHGIEFTESNTDLLSLSTHWFNRDSATVVINWGVALMTLIMLFTGLRRESLLRLKVGDWAEICPGLFVLAWRHSKKKEENLVIVPASVIRLLELYVHPTQKVRQSLETDIVFLSGNQHGCWDTYTDKTRINRRLAQFAERHGFEREGKVIALNCMVLRRTYVTRELYEGRSIWIIRLQLGHKDIDTTQRYAQFDRYEHPFQVNSALDEYGRVALTLWRKPIILEDLNPEEREKHLGFKNTRHQDIGQCAHDHCLKINEGSLPPCSLCEHLLTGSEFLPEWENEYLRRKHELEKLNKIPEARHILAQMKSQFLSFEENYTFVKERCKA